MKKANLESEIRATATSPSVNRYHAAQSLREREVQSCTDVGGSCTHLKTWHVRHSKYLLHEAGANAFLKGIAAGGGTR